MSYFVLKNAEGKAVAVLSTVDIVTVSMNGDTMAVKYAKMHDEVYFTITNVVNLDDFFNMISGDQYKSYGETCSGDTCNSVGCGDVSNTPELNKYYRYHAIFHENSAEILSLENIYTLFVTPTDMVYTTMHDSIVHKVPYQTYGNLFEKLKTTNMFYIIDDVIAIYIYGIARFNMRLNENGLYLLSIRYNGQHNYTTYTLNIDDDRAIHLLNSISNL